MTSDLLKEAYGAMQHNRRRTTLTMLGMAWGIATVVILLAFGSGFERAITLIFSSWGTDVIGAFPGRTSLQAGGAKMCIRDSLPVCPAQGREESRARAVIAIPAPGICVIGRIDGAVAPVSYTHLDVYKRQVFS